MRADFFAPHLKTNLSSSLYLRACALDFFFSTLYAVDNAYAQRQGISTKFCISLSLYLFLFAKHRYAEISFYLPYLVYNRFILFFCSFYGP